MEYKVNWKVKLILVFLLFVEILSAQNQRLLINITDSSSSRLTTKEIKKLKIRDEYPDSISRNKARQKLLFNLYDQGYLAAGIDSIKTDSLTSTVFVHLGQKYNWILLTRGNVEEEILSEIGYRQKIYQRKPIYFREVRQIEEKILKFMENHGYPFASIKLDSISLGSGSIQAVLRITKNHIYHIDSLHIKGTATISRIYLYNYLGIKPGSLYNEELIRQISTRIKELPFLKEIRPFELTFTADQAHLYIYIDNKKASQFDFILGFVPDKDNTAKINFTGEAHLKLQNSFGRGEIFELNWKSPLPLTQNLKVNLIYPFVFKTPFGLDAALELYKKDTSYVDVAENIGVQYILKRGSYFKAFYINKSSSLISTKPFESGLVKPDRFDFQANSYGLGLRTENLDYKYNPHKGYVVQFNTTLGLRKIIKNSKLGEDLYKDIPLTASIYHLDFTGEYYIPLTTRSVIALNGKAASYVSTKILSNELFRIGGLKTLRGFDEESIYASTYLIGNAEYRFILEQNSYLFGFYNTAYYENKASINFIHDIPYGFGAGITFETKLGIFSFTYALGKQFNNPVYLRSGKIHFGIISYF